MRDYVVPAILLPMRSQSATPQPRQPKAILVDDRLRRELGDGLIDVVTRLRAQGESWTSIADRLSRWTDLPVSRQLLQQWHASWNDAQEVPA